MSNNTNIRKMTAGDKQAVIEMSAIFAVMQVRFCI